jgi:hypothetical protein
MAGVSPCQAMYNVFLSKVHIRDLLRMYTVIETASP